MNDRRADAPVEVLVEDYLKGDVSFQEAVASMPGDNKSWGDWVLQVLLPADFFRRRLERMDRRRSRVLVTGSHEN